MAKHGESKHTKRSSVTNRVVVPRKKYKYYFRPLPSSHKKQYSIALLGFLRDIMKIAKTAKEASFLLKQGYVKLDGKIIKDKKREVGFGDLVSVRGKNFKVWLDERGKLISAPDEESGERKKLKVISKHLDKGGAQILSLSDGSNIKMGDKSVNVNDSVVIDLKQRKIEKVLPMEQGKEVIVFMGANAGNAGRVKEISGKEVEVELKGREIKASIDSCMVL